MYKQDFAFFRSILHELDTLRNHAEEFREMLSLPSSICGPMMPACMLLFCDPHSSASFALQIEGNSAAGVEASSVRAGFVQRVVFEEPKPVDEWLPPQLQKPATDEQREERWLMKLRIKNVLWQRYPWYRQAPDFLFASRSRLLRLFGCKSGMSTWQSNTIAHYR